MNPSLRRIVIGGIFFGVTCLVAVIGYVVSGWPLMDAVYMVTITIFGVGYGEVQPLDTPGLKVFTMAVIIAGCSSGIYVVGGFVQMIAEGEINKALGVRRMSLGIEKLKDHALICGFGRVGQMLAHDLLEAKFPFVIIDSNEARIQQAQALGYLTYLGNGSEEPTLLAAGIHRAKVLATVLPDDAANVFITLTARELNSTLEIIARAETPSTEKKLIRSGANRVVMPAFIGATKISHMITRPSAEDMLAQATGNLHLNDELKQLGLELTEIELKPNSALDGQTISNLEGEGAAGFVLVAVKKKDGTILNNPPSQTPLAAGDILVILGHADALPQLTWKAKPKATMTYRGASV